MDGNGLRSICSCGKYTGGLWDGWAGRRRDSQITTGFHAFPQCNINILYLSNTTEKREREQETADRREKFCNRCQNGYKNRQTGKIPHYRGYLQLRAESNFTGRHGRSPAIQNHQRICVTRTHGLGGGMKGWRDGTISGGAVGNKPPTSIRT
jgi:hypothetical protein